MMPSAMTSGIEGVKAGISWLDQSAQTIASNSLGESPSALNDVSSAVVGLAQSSNQVAANVKTIKASSSMLGTLIDMRV